MSNEKMPLVDADTSDTEAIGSTTDIARMHSLETPESALVPQEGSEAFALENSESKMIEPPEAITNVSEVVGIAEEQKEEINMLGDLAYDIRRATAVLERIKDLKPEQVKPREESLVNERKQYLNDFIAETRTIKKELVKEGVATLRGLPNAKEIEDAVSLNDEATIGELTWRKKDKNQPLSKEEERALSRAFKSRDRFFDQLKVLGIEKRSARELYYQMISEKTTEIRKGIPPSVSREQKIAEAKEYFEGIEATKKADTKEAEGVTTPFLTPETLSVIEALHEQLSEKDAEDLSALSNTTDIEELLRNIPPPSWNYQTPNIDESASPEMLEALKRDGIHLKEGKKYTALEATILRRKVLGKRNSEDIERIAKQAYKRSQRVDSEIRVPSTEGMNVEELNVEEIVISPIEEASRTEDVRRERGRALLDATHPSLGRTEEMRRRKGRELLDWNDEEHQDRVAVDHEALWGVMSDEEKQKALSESRFLFTEGGSYHIPGALEAWTLVSILDNGVAQMRSPDGLAQKNISLLELRDLNITTETPHEIVGDVAAEEKIETEELSASQVLAQIAELEAQASRTKEEDERLKGLKWLRDNGRMNETSDEDVSSNIALKEVEKLLPNAVLSRESKNEIVRVSALVLPHDVEILAQAKEDVLANGTKEEQDAYRMAEERWENFMDSLEGMGIDPDIAEKIYNKVAEGEVRSIDERVIEQYHERFNIDKEVLEGISGFTELTSGQQLLVLENFKNTAAQDVSAEGLKLYKEDLKKSGFWGRAWKSMTKQYQIGKAKGVVAEKWNKGESKEALAMKRDTLEGLTKIALTQKEFDVIEKDGTLEMQFASEKLFGDKELSQEEKDSLVRFNEAANRYANLDFTGMEGKEEDLRGMAEKEYQASLEAVTAIYGEHAPVEGITWQHKVRSAVQMNRFFADNPELEKDLDRSVGMSALLSAKNTLVERTAITGAGMGLRIAAVSALGTAGLFVAAPIVGGFLGARRAKQTIAEKDLLARMGEHDMSDEQRHENLEEKNRSGAKNVVNEKDVAKNIIDADILIKKLSFTLRDIDEVNETQMVEQAKRDEYGALIRNEKGEVVKETISKKAQLLNSLDARIEYTKRKLEEELVNLGGTNAIRINAINDLMEKLGHAEALVALERPESKNLLTERLDDLLDIRKEKIEDNRKYLVRKEATKGAVLATGFALAGTGIGWAVRHGVDAGWFGGTPKPSPSVVPSSGEVVTPPAHHVEAHHSLFTQENPPSGRLEDVPGYAEYVRDFNDNISHIIGANTTRAPLSIEELAALRQAAGIDGARGANDAVYNALILEMRKSPVALNNEAIRQIMSHYGEHLPSSGAVPSGEAIHALGNGSTPQVEVAPPLDLHSGVESSATVIASHALETTPKVYSVGSGDTLTSILKEHVSEVHALSSDGQENAIQNFLRSLSAEDLKQIGVTDPNKLSVGQSLNLEKVVQLLHEKQVGGTDILKHAEMLTGSGGSGATQGAIDAHLGAGSSSVVHSAQDAIPHATTPSASGEAVATTSSAPVALHNPSPSDVVGNDAGGVAHVGEAAHSSWHDIPQSTRLLEADTTAQKYLENDITTLYGPQSKFGYWPRAWTSISLRNAAAVLTQTKDTDPHQLLAGADEIPPGYEWSNVEKLQHYLRAEGITKENGFVPQENENIAAFIKRALAEKIMNEGPTRTPSGN